MCLGLTEAAPWSHVALLFPLSLQVNESDTIHNIAILPSSRAVFDALVAGEWQAGVWGAGQEERFVRWHVGLNRPALGEGGWPAR